MENTTVLPAALLEEILSRLPVRHLLRMRCVCKPWCAYIDDYSFMKKQYQYQYAVCRAAGSVPLFLEKSVPFFLQLTPFAHFAVHDQAHVYLLSKQQGDDVVSDLTPNLLRDIAPNYSDFLHKFKCCLGVVSGIVLLQWCDMDLVLWNPATREFKAVPSWPTLPDKQPVADIVGFGFDPVSNDFKIVGYILGSCLQPLRGYEMYSLRANSWKRLQGPPVSAFATFSGTDGYLNGVYYWEAQIFDAGKTIPRLGLLSFNFSTEVFKVFDPPQCAPYVLPDGSCGWKIRLYMDSLAWIVRRDDNLRDQAVCCFDIWIADKFDKDGYGIPLSWQRLITIGPIPALNYLSFRTFCMDGDMLLNIGSKPSEEEANLYNPSTNTFKKLGVALDRCFRYVESTFPLSKRLAQI